ncbi:MAG TPA: SepM family pheromone-processing serine protease [Bacillales bacterium]|nr:SepM family pheromone-processing serine protease [Bacillales bacterium]
MEQQKKRIGYIIFVIILALVMISFFYRLPYSVMKPGEAHDLDPVIRVKGGHQYDDGDFMFMTVRVVQGINVYQYLLAKFLKYHKLLPTRDLRLKWESHKEYEARQLHYMDKSQIEATYVAYERAGKHPQIVHNGLLVIGLIDGMPAENQLEAGDVIVGAEGKPVKTRKDLFQVMKGKKQGDSVELKIVRDGKKKTVTVSVAQFPKGYTENNGDGKKYGIGIIQVPDIALKVNPPIRFDTGGIGGPSGGLMFSLDIFNQLTEKNWTKGYKIAGTGEINIEGEVGSIGGIKEKVVAADEENVEIFFAPKKDGNYKNAVEAAKDIGTDMKIVPVKTFDDALDYLRKLPPKNDKGSKAA